MSRIFEMKRDAVSLRKIVSTQLEVFSRLTSPGFGIISEEHVVYFRDVHDHLIRVFEAMDSYRELMSGALDAYLSNVSNRMNEVMKALTLVATIMLPLTFIAGVYGMNFEVMPELKWKYGYVFALGLMGLVAAGIIRWFKHKTWL